MNPMGENFSFYNYVRKQLITITWRIDPYPD
jgi:hypothetical protein